MPDAHARGWGDPSRKGYREQHIVTIDTPVGKLSVRSEVAHLFLGFLQEIAARGFRFNARSDDWGFAPRPIRGYEEKWKQTHDFHYWSNHGWGMAVDLDAVDHPLGKRNTGIPRWVVDIAHRWGLSWGGDYVTRPDEMHWEYLGTPADVAKYPIREQQTIPLPAPRITTTGDDVRRLDLAIDIDKDGHGYRDIDAKALDVISVVANTANPPDSGYKPIPDVARLDVAGKARIVVEEAVPSGRIDVSVWLVK